MRFTALSTFHAPETDSIYIEGLAYTVRPGNGRLARLVEDWIRDGKVAVVKGGGNAVIEGRS